MSTSQWQPLPSMSSHCFACGQENPHGMGMHFYSNGSMLYSEIEVPEHLCGWGSLVHGGILCTILDEVMSWTAMHLWSSYILTRDMSVRFRRPVYIQTPLLGYGWVKEGGEKRQAILAAEIRDRNNKVCTSGEGTYALFSPERLARSNLLGSDGV